jgi:hypothetical protein
MRPIIFSFFLTSLTGCIGAKAGYWLVQSEKASNAANLVGAGEEDSLYEFILAEQYRQKAWEEAGYSEYEASERFARESIEHYDTAREVAIHGHEELNLFEQLDADEELLPDLFSPIPEADEMQEEETPSPIDDLFAPEDDSDDLWDLDDLLGD